MADAPQDPIPRAAERRPAANPSGDAGDAPGRAARTRAQAEQLRRRADETVKGLEARRSANRWIDAGFSTFERDVRSGGGVLAAALAFRIFIFMVPFVFVIVTAFPFVGDVSNRSSQDLADSFGMTGLVAGAITNAQEMTFWSRLWLLAFGVFALVLAARSLVRVLRITHGLAWNARVPKLRRPTLAGAALIGSVLGLVLFTTWTSSLEDRIGLLGLVPMLFTSVVVVGFWTVVQYYLPRADVRWTELIPGSVLVAVGVQGLQLVTVVWFTRSIESKSETYGAIGAALAILLWAYFLGRILVSGAMLNAALHEQPRSGPVRSRGAPRAE
ncbi:MAG: YihY/virulence factor BrkB family protein [Actinomycetota bacterium]